MAGFPSGQWAARCVRWTHRDERLRRNISWSTWPCPLCLSRLKTSTWPHNFWRILRFSQSNYHLFSLHQLTFTLHPPLWSVGVLWHEQFSHNKGNITLVLMHSGIVNRYQILCLNDIGELQLFFYFTHYHPFPLFLFMCLLLWQSYFFSWLGASLVYVNNLKRTADFVLWSLTGQLSVHTLGRTLI